MITTTYDRKAATFTTLSALTVVLAATFANAAEFPSHCSKSETTVFSCKLQFMEKYVSLCGSKPLKGSQNYLVYRFGPLRRMEMSYPAGTPASLHSFKAHHYFRAQVDRRSISFMRSGVTYDIFSNFEGEESPPQRQAGVTVAVAGKTTSTKTLYCATPYFDKLELLDGVLQEGSDVADDDD